MRYRIIYLCRECEIRANHGGLVKACSNCTDFTDGKIYNTLEAAAKHRSMSGDLIFDADTLELVDSNEWLFYWEKEDSWLKKLTSMAQSGPYAPHMLKLHRAAKAKRFVGRACCRCG